MKKITLFLLSILLSISLGFAQTTINVSSPGSLSSLIGANKTTVTNLTLTGTLNDADFQTIKEMTALKTLNLSAVTNTDLPNSAFQGRKMDQIVLPKGLKTIGVSAFNGSNMQQPLILPNGVEIIKEYTFYNTVANEIILPAKLKVVEQFGFANAKISSSIDFSVCPDLTTMGIQAFANIKLPGDINISKNTLLINTNQPFVGITNRVILDPNMVYLPDNILRGYQGTVDLPKTLKTIGVSAFSGSNMQQPLILPNRVEIIKEYAFYNATANEIILPAKLKVVEQFGFANAKISSSIDFSVCPGLTTLGKNSLGNLTMPGDIDISKCTQLSTTTWPFVGITNRVILCPTMIDLPDYIFLGFKGSVELPEGLKTIGVHSFNGSALQHPLTIPDGVTTIKDYAFRFAKIDEIIFPKQLQSLGTNVFEESNISSSLDFSGCPELKTFKQPFIGITNRVILCPTMIDLPDYIFLGFKGLVELPEGLKTIGVHSFNGSVLQHPLILPDGVTTIKDYAFRFAIMDKIVFPNSVESLGVGVFEESKIKTITLPENLKTIGSLAFSGCSKLEKIISKNPIPPSLGNGVFYNVDKTTCVLNVPSDEAEALYKQANQWKDFLGTYVAVDVPETVKLHYRIPAQIGTNGSGNGQSANFNVVPGAPYVEVDYTGIRIGEYYWMDKNFNHIEPTRAHWSVGDFIGRENTYEFSQYYIDRMLDYLEADKSKFQVDIDTFRTYFGQYYHYETRNMMHAAEMTEDGKLNPYDTRDKANVWQAVYIPDRGEGWWKLPTYGDFRQLMAMSPHFHARDVLTPNDVQRALGVRYGDNPMTSAVIPYYDYAKYCSTETLTDYWYLRPGGKPTYPFKMMPSGLRYNEVRNDDELYWTTTLCEQGEEPDPKDQVSKFRAYTGELYSLFNVAAFMIDDPSRIRIALVGDRIMTDSRDKQTWSYHCTPIRWCRLLTDAELGYKIFIKVDGLSKTSAEWTSLAAGDEISLLRSIRAGRIDAEKVSIQRIMNPKATVPDADYVELPHGYLRGFYVQYNINAVTKKTDAQIAVYASKVNDSVLQDSFSSTASTTPVATKTLVTDVPTVSIYPNPVVDVLNINTDKKLKSVSIYNLSGSRSLYKNSFSNNTVDVSRLSAGTYIIRIDTEDGGLETFKIVKK